MIAPCSVVITGASSGLGEALALRYAARGARLGLIGRNVARLEAVAARVRQAGSVTVETAALDVRDRAALAAWIGAFDDRGPADLLIANAGVVGGTGLAGDIENADGSGRIFAINVGGTVNTIHAILPRMVERRAGQIAVVSSLAGFVRLPDLPSYSASKAAIMSYALNLRDTVGPLGVAVNVVCPGYVDTPMARQLRGARLFEVTPAYAAAAIERGLARNRRIVAFPFALATVTRVASILPSPLVRAFAPSFRVTKREND